MYQQLHANHSSRRRACTDTRQVHSPLGPKKTRDNKDEISMNVMRSWRFIRVILHTFATMRQHCFSTVVAVLDDADDSDRDLFSNWDLDLFSAMCNDVF